MCIVHLCVTIQETRFGNLSVPTPTNPLARFDVYDYERVVKKGPSFPPTPRRVVRLAPHSQRSDPFPTPLAPASIDTTPRSQVQPKSPLCSYPPFSPPPSCSPFALLMVHVLNVAEKPSVAKALSEVFSNSARSPLSSAAGRSQYNRIYTVDGVRFPDPRSRGPPAPHKMVMTSVAGHISGRDFKPPYNKWHSCEDVALFEAPLVTEVAPQFVDLRDEVRAEFRVSFP